MTDSKEVSKIIKAMRIKQFKVGFWQFATGLLWTGISFPIIAVIAGIMTKVCVIVFMWAYNLIQ